MAKFAVDKSLYKESKKIEKVDWLSIKPSPVIGVDEVGRGCLAGSVYAAAVILSSEIDRFEWYQDLTDSKKLSESRREELANKIISTQQVSIAFATVEEIDEINILKASLLAMHRAVLGLKVRFGHVAVDGNFKIPNLKNFEQTCFIKGDLRVSPISAASIVAKVARDQYMKELSINVPQYGFDIHKGYGTPQHRDLIKQFGPSLFHRKTFAGVKEFSK